MEFCENSIDGLGPDEGFGTGIVLGKIGVDGGLQVSDRAEDAAPDALAGDFGEEILDRVEPGSRGRGEVKSPARMARQPSQHFGVFMGGVVVEHDMDRLVGHDLAFDGVEKSNEFEMPVALHAAADHAAVEHAERGEQGGGAPRLRGGRLLRL